MPPKRHAILSASSFDRWLHCPPSARLCETYEDKGSNYAAEGTDAHSLCEYKLRKALGMKATDPTKNLDWYNAEMEDCATGYACFIMELLEETKQTCSDPVLLIEQRVDFSRWVEQGFGTSDAILISDGTMHVIDYKHGLGILVSAEDNSQMKCYALGALELFDDIYDIDTVSMTIYQPRRQNISTCEVSKDDLYQWADEVLKPTADIPTKTQCRKLSKLLVLTLTKRSCLVSQLCKSCSAKLALKIFLQPISKSHKANLLLCRKVINARQ